MQLAAKFIVEEDAEAMQKELKEAFRLYDKEGNGFIPTSCLKEILRELDDQLTDHELDCMIEEIDSDGSGTVDFDGEFGSAGRRGHRAFGASAFYFTAVTCRRLACVRLSGSLAQFGADFGAGWA